MSQPVVRIEITTGTGERLVREWTIDEGPPKPNSQPWMRNPTRSWANPQDPITLRAIVDFEHEKEAREWLASL
jgi:hypothetical protein